MRYEMVTTETLDAVIEHCLNPDKGLLGLDVETTGLNVDPLGEDIVVSLQLAPSADVGYLIPLRFVGIGAECNVPLDVAKAAMQRIWDAAKARKLRLIAANCAFDLDALHSWHCTWWPRECIGDPLIRCWLKDPVNADGVHFGLKARVKFHLGVQMSLFDALVPKMRASVSHPLLSVKDKRWLSYMYNTLDPRATDVLEYGCEDAIYARELYLAVKLSPQQQQLELVELATSENVRRYRQHGLMVNRQGVCDLFDALTERLDAVDRQIVTLLDGPVPVGSCYGTRAINAVLAPQYLWLERKGRAKAKLKTWREKKTRVNEKGRTVRDMIARTDKRFSVDIKVLGKMRDIDDLRLQDALIGNDPMPALSPLQRTLVELLLERAPLGKDLRTYLPALGYCDETGRLRFDAKTYGIDTARLTGGRQTGGKRVPWQLNALTLPKRARLKHCIVAPEGYVILQLDVRSQEPRYAACYSRDKAMVHLFNEGTGDFHKLNASFITGKPLDEVSKDERTAAKPIGLGLFYNLSPLTLQEKFIDTHEHPYDYANGIRDAVYGGYAGMARFAAACRLRAVIAGVSNTRYGRQIPTRKWVKRGKRRLEDKFTDGVNATIQASGSDCLRILLDAAHAWLDEHAPQSHLVGSVHDSIELRYRVSDLPKLWDLVAALEDAMNSDGLPVPMRLDVQLGYSLGSLYEVAPGKPLARENPGLALDPSEIETGAVGKSGPIVTCPVIAAALSI